MTLQEATELCRKYPPGTGIDSQSEFERFSEAREVIVAAYLKETLTFQDKLDIMVENLMNGVEV